MTWKVVIDNHKTPNTLNPLTNATELNSRSHTFFVSFLIYYFFFTESNKMKRRKKKQQEN